MPGISPRGKKRGKPATKASGLFALVRLRAVASAAFRDKKLTGFMSAN
jgi:hypothetical protein